MSTRTRNDHSPAARRSTATRSALSTAFALIAVLTVGCATDSPMAPMMDDEQDVSAQPPEVVDREELDDPRRPRDEDAYFDDEDAWGDNDRDEDLPDIHQDEDAYDGGGSSDDGLPDIEDQLPGGSL